MEDVLDVYARPHDPRYPVVCVDEFCKQLIAETRTTIPAKPDQTERYDYEYERHGCATAYMIYAPLEGKRRILISESATRTRIDYAWVMEYISTVMFPDAITIILVEDNLNTHGNASLYEAFAPAKARQIASRFERHHTPKHGSWLNIAESEIAAVLTTSIAERVGSLEKFRNQCALAEARRNEKSLTTRWQFTTDAARIKLHSLYPSVQV